MKHIIIGTHRPDSNSKKVAHFVQNLFKLKGEEVAIINISEIELEQSHGGHYGGKTQLPAKLSKAIDDIETSDGLIFVVPEYNGSFPGVLKSFIDYWKFPQSFEGRPVAYIGIGAMWGGLRPVEHLMQVMSYRNAYNFPIRVFMQNVWKMLDAEGNVTDTLVLSLLNQQVDGFQKFCRALKAEELDANSLNAKRPK